MTRFLLALAILFWTAPALAQVDGDKIGFVDKGSYRMVEYWLCKGDGDGTCDAFDLQTAEGFPDYFVVEIDTETCTVNTPEVTPFASRTDGGQSHDLVTSALVITGTSAVVIEWVTHRFVDATIADVADCTDIGVILRLFYARSRP